jgi:hypothetical protein
LNFSKFKEFVSDLATLVVRDVHSQLSNIWKKNLQNGLTFHMKYVILSIW